MNAETIVSQYAATVFMCGLILVCIGAAAIAVGVSLIREAAKRFRAALLGLKLLRVCHGDYEIAEQAIETYRAENKLLEDNFKAVLLAEAEESRAFRKRQAEFNAACQDLSGMGPRWTDVV